MTDNDSTIDVTGALAHVNVPAALIDKHGRIRWLNRGAAELVGARVGQPFAHAIAPHDVHLARTHFARKLIGEASSSQYEMTLVGRAGRRLRVRVSSVPFWENGEITGVFGLAVPAAGDDGEATSAHATAGPQLTARQYEALTLLADGLGTTAIAARLGVAEETVRNHIRGLLRELGVHSRLEAVVRAYQLGLLPSRDDD